MGYFPVRYDSRVIIYECKMFIRLATEGNLVFNIRSTGDDVIQFIIFRQNTLIGCNKSRDKF